MKTDKLRRRLIEIRHGWSVLGYFVSLRSDFIEHSEKDIIGREIIQLFNYFLFLFLFF